MKTWVCPICRRVIFYGSAKAIRKARNKHLKTHREKAKKGLKGQGELIDYIYNLDYWTQTYKQSDVSTEEGFRQLVNELVGE